MLEQFLQKLAFKGYSEQTIKVYNYFLRDKWEKILNGEIDEKWFSENLITRANQVNIINSFIKFVNENGGNIKKLENVKLPKRELRILEYEKICEKINELSEDTFEGVRNKLILLVLMKTGIRASELLNIKITDFDVNGGLIYIKGKGNKERKVWLNGVMELMNRYLSLREQIARCDYMFITQHGYRMSRTLLYEIVKNFLKKFGIKEKLGPHHLRHAFASHLAKKANPFVLQKILGHSNLNTTLKYIHNFENEIKLALEGL